MNRLLYYYNTPFYFLTIFAVAWLKYDQLREMTQSEQEKFITDFLNSVKIEIFALNTLLYSLIFTNLT